MVTSGQTPRGREGSRLTIRDGTLKLKFLEYASLLIGGQDLASEYVLEQRSAFFVGVRSTSRVSSVNNARTRKGKISHMYFIPCN
jgi:hypothetical protein